jgi:hypothetical protein
VEMEQDRWAAVGAVEWDKAGVVDKAEAEWADRLPPDPAETAFVPRVDKPRRILPASPVTNKSARSAGRQ